MNTSGTFLESELLGNLMKTMDFFPLEKKKLFLPRLSNGLESVSPSILTVIWVRTLLLGKQRPRFFLTLSRGEAVI